MAAQDRFVYGARYVPTKKMEKDMSASFNPENGLPSKTDMNLNQRDELLIAHDEESKSVKLQEAKTKKVVVEKNSEPIANGRKKPKIYAWWGNRKNKRKDASRAKKTGKGSLMFLNAKSDIHVRNNSELLENPQTRISWWKSNRKPKSKNSPQNADQLVCMLSQIENEFGFEIVENEERLDKTENTESKELQSFDEVLSETVNSEYSAENLLLDATLECLRRTLENKSLPNFKRKIKMLKIEGSHLKVSGFSTLNRFGNAKVEHKDNMVHVEIGVKVTELLITGNARIHSMKFSSVALHGIEMFLGMDLPLKSSGMPMIEITKLNAIGSIVFDLDDDTGKAISLLLNKSKNFWIPVLLKIANKVISRKVVAIFK